jgi:hypothetical protein
VVDHYVARTGVDSQQTDQPAGDDPVDLWSPVDADADHGDRGPFRKLEGGMTNPKWLAGVPKLVMDVGASFAARARAVAEER